MKRYIRSATDAEYTSIFHIGDEYKLLCRDGSEAVRTFVVVNLSHKNMAIKVKGGINGIYDIRKSGDHEMIPLGMKDRNYLNPSSKDVIRRSNA